MFTKTFVVAALVAYAEARFGQEQCSPALADIQAVTSGGQPGQAATLAGGAISNLLAAANPCNQLSTADNIVATLGTGADSIKAAQEFINCEKNFNPFVQDTPTLCSDPTLPTTAALRGILSKIDPAVGGADLANQLAAQSLTTPFDATGLSMADIFAANGFSNFTTEDAAGNKGAAAAASVATAAAATAAAAATDTTSASATAAAAASAATTDSSADEGVCAADTVEATTSTVAAAAATTLATVTTTAAAAAAATTAAAVSGTSTDATATGGGSITNTVSTVAGVDFGLCNPGMIFESGLNNRPPTEFTFQAADSKIRAIQQEALNHNIITNRICDCLTNMCQSNQAAKDLCAQAKAAVTGLTNVRATADTWNTMLGFAGQDTNPDNTSLVGEPTK